MTLAVLALAASVALAKDPPNPAYAPARWSKDPYVLKDGKSFVLYTTDIRALHSAVSKDLLHWTDDRDVAIEGESSLFVWAPSVLEQGGEFFLYYAAGDKRLDGNIDWPTFRIRVAKATDPRGPFTLVGDLLTPPRPFAGQDDAGLIDPEIVRDKDGSLVCFHVAVLDGIPGKRNYWEGIRARRLKSPTEVDPDSPDTRLIDPAGNDTWEQNIVEAPTVWRAGGRWAMLYSGGASSRGQSLGVAFADSMLGPWTKSAEARRPEGKAVWTPKDAGTWAAASVGSTAIIEAGGTLRLVYQGLDVPEGSTRPSHWTIGVDSIVAGRDKVVVVRRH